MCFVKKCLPFVLAVFFWTFSYLSAFREGRVLEYNPVSWYREAVAPVAVKEIAHYGVVAEGPFDFFSDASYQKFLDDDYAFATGYVPSDLVSIRSDFTANASSPFFLRAEAAKQFADMAWSFAYAFDFDSKLSLTSAYRSSGFQRRLASNCSIERCAMPGSSEHEAGLAVDVGVNGGNILGDGGVYYQWLASNAHLRGFHNTYQKGVHIDGKIVEPWHWRYVGVALATYLHESQQTLAEYFYSIYPK